MTKKILLVIFSPILILIFIIGLIIYPFNKKTAILDFVFDAVENLYGGTF